MKLKIKNIDEKSQNMKRCTKENKKKEKEREMTKKKKKWNERQRRNKQRKEKKENIQNQKECGKSKIKCQKVLKFDMALMGHHSSTTTMLWCV